MCVVIYLLHASGAGLLQLCCTCSGNGQKGQKGSDQANKGMNFNFLTDQQTDWWSDTLRFPQLLTSWGLLALRFSCLGRVGFGWQWDFNICQRVTVAVHNAVHNVYDSNCLFVSIMLNSLFISCPSLHKWYHGSFEVHEIISEILFHE